ncbi:MAG: hypothetical protein OER12_08110 [Acidimicrobiia bacterium]|nr:hypothetical protein [Acidimicrobiia bacterium]
MGVLAAKKVASKREEGLDGASDSGIAATIPQGEQLMIGLSDRRMLFFKIGAMSGNPKDWRPQWSSATSTS